MDCFSHLFILEAPWLVSVRGNDRCSREQDTTESAGILPKTHTASKLSTDKYEGADHATQAAADVTGYRRALRFDGWAHLDELQNLLWHALCLIKMFILMLLQGVFSVGAV